MVRFSAVPKDQLNTLVSILEQRGRLPLYDKNVVSFWTTGEIEVNAIDADEKDTLADIIKDINICTEDEVRKVLLSEDDFVIEV